MALPVGPATSVKNAIHARLLADADVTGAIATYEGVSAIFAGRAVPVDAVRPYIHIRPVAASTDDLLVERGRQVMVDIAAYAADGGSIDAIDSLAEGIRNLFHRQSLELAGGCTVIAVRCDPPVDAPDEPDGVIGRIVTLYITLRE